MDDKEIISLYWQRSETAIAETDKKYRRLCLSVAGNILSDISDAEECTNDAYLAVWKRIPPERPLNFPAFVCRIVKNLALKKYEFIHAAKRDPRVTSAIDELDDIADCNSDIGELCDKKELGEKISGFLKNERKLNRVVFIRRYWFFDSVSDIAGRCSMSETAVKALLYRMRGRLREYLIKEGVFLEK